jgi:hypothetical protein
MINHRFSNFSGQRLRQFLCRRTGSFHLILTLLSKLIKYIFAVETRGGAMAKDLVAVGNAGATDGKRALTPAQCGDLADAPPDLEWLANITNPKIRRGLQDRCRRV